jgi:hypothetical protein
VVIVPLGGGSIGEDGGVQLYLPEDVSYKNCLFIFPLAVRRRFDILRAVVAGQVAPSIFTNNLPWP